MSISSTFPSVYHHGIVAVYHHGSNENHPSDFLERITAEHIAISTSGGSFGHPDSSILRELGKYLEKHPDTNLHFNHSKHCPKGSSIATRDVSREFNTQRKNNSAFRKKMYHHGACRCNQSNASPCFYKGCQGLRRCVFRQHHR